MDELLFQFPELVDYCVKIVEGKKEITALFISDNGEELIRNVWEEKDILSWTAKKQNGRWGIVSWETYYFIEAERNPWYQSDSLPCLLFTDNTDSPL